MSSTYQTKLVKFKKKKNGNFCGARNAAAGLWQDVPVAYFVTKSHREIIYARFELRRFVGRRTTDNNYPTHLTIGTYVRLCSRGTETERRTMMTRAIGWLALGLVSQTDYANSEIGEDNLCSLF